MPATKTQSQTSALPAFDLGAKTLDAVSAIAETQQRVIGQLVELSSLAAADRLRSLGELQSAAAETARGILTPVSAREAFEEFRQDPIACYRKSLLATLDGTQRIVKLFETNAQMISRDTERLQGAAERTAKEIQDAVGTCANRLRELYATAS